jgi:hypothetical protein
VCRGFYDRYDTQALQLARRLWGVVEVPPPAASAGQCAVPARAEPAEASLAAPAGQPPARPGPFAFIDVDGVLNPDGSRQQTLGYRPHRFDTTGPDGQPAGGIVWLHPDHGGWLAELETAGARPVWASWNQLAKPWIAPRLGLSGTWPVADLQGLGGVRWGHALKLDPITRYAGDAPFLLLDDLM